MLTKIQPEIAKLFDTNMVNNTNALIYRFFLIISVISATLLIVVDTNKTIHSKYGDIIIILENFFFFIIFIDYLLRIFRFAIFDGNDEKRRSEKHIAWLYITSFYGFIDIFSATPLLMNILGFDLVDLKTTFGIIAFLKVARFSPALTILKDVIVSERKPLIAALYLMLLLTFSISTILYFVERSANPGFESIPHAMWWAIVTLATLGYGDVVPVTALGKVLGGIAAILGFGMFALPAGILANGFAEEIKRLKDVTNWNMVAKVPLFANIDASIISEIAGLLRVKRFIKNEVIVKEGDKGNAMFFILEGEVNVSKGNWSINLGEGSFFGEIALVKDVPRTATVKANKRCEMLELTTYDFKRTIANRPEILAAIEATAEQRYADNSH